MYCTPIPKAFLLLIFTFLLLSTVAASQETATGELVVSKCWSYSLESGRALVADGSRVYLATSDAQVEAVSLEGKKLWSTELGGVIASNITVNGSGVFVVSFSPANGDKPPSASLRALSKDTGITVWSVKLGESNEHTLAVSETAITVVSANGVLQSIDTKTGSVTWKREIAAAFSGEPSFSAEKVLIASRSNQLFLVSLASGDIDSMRKFATGITAAGRTPNGDAIVGDGRGNVALIPSNEGRAIWNYKSGGSITDVRLVNGHALVTSNDNFAYYLRLQNGDLSWKRRFAGRVTRVGIIDPGIALISSIEEHGATFINLSTGRSVGQILLDSDEFMEADPVSSNGLIFVLTNDRLLAYSLGKCSASK